MKTKFHKLIAQSLIANQSTLAGAALVLLAFAVIAANALFNQPGAHPLPLWSTDSSNSRSILVSENEIEVPLRRVSTKSIIARQIPVPVPRAAPSEIVGNIAPVPNQRPTQLSNEEKIQSRLTQLGFYNGPVDGIIGAKTKLAIIKFERARGLPEIGIPTKLLLTQLSEQPKKTPRPQNETAFTQNFDAKIVTRVQVGLINFGNRKIAIDGLMGKQTRLAIEKFQKRFKLEVTGVPSRDLIKKLVNVGALTAS